MHELTRVRAYARLIVAIAGDDTAKHEARTRAIDTLVDRMVDTEPADHTCKGMTPGTWAYCEGCAAA